VRPYDASPGRRAFPVRTHGSASFSSIPAMPYNPRIHHRRSYRLRGYDYAQPGLYFLTICTHDRACLFGTIADGIMVNSDLGDLVSLEWLRSFELRAEVVCDTWVLMPNHLHAVVGIAGDETPTAAPPSPVRTHGSASLHRAPRSISSFVAGFKAAATKWVNHARGTPGAPLWLPRFYDHVIRTNHAAESIRAYVRTNPDRWPHDIDNPNGDGKDDHERFVRDLDLSADGEGRTAVRPYNQSHAHQHHDHP